MTKNPDFNYNEFCLDGFIKSFPILSEADPCVLAQWLYGIVSAFSGRDGRSLAGGGEDDIKCLLSAAAAVEIDICSARSIKDALSRRLRRAWMANDHATIMSVARGFERTASMAVINHRGIDWVNPYRIIEDQEEKRIEIPEAIEEWIAVLCEPSLWHTTAGNRSRNRIRRKPVEMAVLSLFEVVA